MRKDAEPQCNITRKENKNVCVVPQHAYLRRSPEKTTDNYVTKASKSKSRSRHYAS